MIKQHFKKKSQGVEEIHHKPRSACSFHIELVISVLHLNLTAFTLHEINEERKKRELCTINKSVCHHIMFMHCLCKIFQDPIMNPDLVKKVPSERQGQILQQLTELRKVSRISAV